ncbi:S8 family serine peptidase [Methylibium sp.]|uniref:S8 family serine peptidase n=1 Tax=Methylibium sp. TaxID=2067992 RepID=UPI003D10B638
MPLASEGAAAQAGTAAASGPMARVIVKYKAGSGDSVVRVQGAGEGRATVQRLDARLGGMAQRQGLALRAHRAITERTQVVLAQGIDSATLAQRLAADPEVEYAVPDRWVRRAAVPSDPLYLTGGGAGPVVGQWYLRAPNSTARSAIDATTAWDTTQGSANVVVAVIDTGVRFDHPDLAGKLLSGFDFVTDPNDANDGTGRDSDASDPGDWITSQEDNSVGGQYFHCSTPSASGVYDGEDSSWHGTQVAGIVGALTNNGVGMAGTGWNTRVLPVRVLGKCGGFVSDVVAGMRWAAGLTVPGVSAVNSTPAKVLNLSLGTTGACAEYQDAVDDVIAAGAVVVAAAGNTNGHAVGAPANCSGVIAVGGLRHTGTKVGFSDLGSAVSISAPAGNCVNDFGPCLYPLLTTTNAGTQGPTSSTYTDGTTNLTIGTSFSAPLVSGVAALMFAAQPSLTPAQVRALIQGGARAFPTTGADPGTPQCTAPQSTSAGTPIDQDECYCTTATCGAGMLDARTAVRSAAAGLISAIGVSPASPQAEQAVALNASVSVLINGRSLSGITWSLVDGGGIVSSLSGVSGANASVTPSAAGSFTVAVTVTDNTGAQSTTSRRVTVAAAPSTGGGGGGGGALSPGYLLALLLAVGAAWRLRGRSDPAA